MLSHRYRVNSPDVIRESFEDEVVVVNLESGIYYSFDKVGAEIWSQLEAGRDCQQIADTVQQQYSGDTNEITRETERFIKQLVDESLIVIDESTTTLALAEQPAVLEKRKFLPPALNKYTDMQELLLLDPIHEVDEAGWPSVKKESAGN